MIQLYNIIRKIKYSFYTKNTIKGKFKAHQPVVSRGKGHIALGNNNEFGVINSPLFLNTYAYLEARHNTSTINIGNNCRFNNNLSITSEKNITIGNNVLAGYNCSITDSNFHNLNALKRDSTDPNPKQVIVGNNVFMGNNVTILKGVTLGDNVVVGANTVVTKSFPDNSVIAGNPAKQISKST